MLVLAAPERVATVTATAADRSALEGCAARVAVVCGEEDAEPNLPAEAPDRRLQDGQVGNDNGNEFLTDGPCAAADCAFRPGLVGVGMSA